MEIKNAIIKSTRLGFNDHGIFTFYIDLQYNGSCQSFGGYSLGIYDTSQNKRQGTVWGCTLLMRILETLDVDSWERLPNTPCRAKINDRLIVALGHFLKDQWIDITDASI